MWKLFIDDERMPVIPREWVIARTSQEAMNYVEDRGMPQEISFDHDLGGEDTSIRFLKWLTEQLLDGKVFIPFGFKYSIHSQNPVGVKNIEAYMQDILKISFDAPLSFPEIDPDFDVPKHEVVKPKVVQLTDDEQLEQARNLLAEKMPRLFKAAALLWGHKEFEDWMDKLIVSDRRDRQGFPPDVLAALLVLSRLHEKKFGSFKKSDIWMANRQIF